MVYILPVCFPLNMSKCNSENAVWIVSDSLDLIVYICRILDLNYYQSYFQKYEHRIGFIAVDAHPQF